MTSWQPLRSPQTIDYGARSPHWRTDTRAGQKMSDHTNSAVMYTCVSSRLKHNPLMSGVDHCRKFSLSFGDYRNSYNLVRASRVNMTILSLGCTLSGRIHCLWDCCLVFVARNIALSQTTVKANGRNIQVCETRLNWIVYVWRIPVVTKLMRNNIN